MILRFGMTQTEALAFVKTQQPYFPAYLMDMEDPNG